MLPWLRPEGLVVGLAVAVAAEIPGRLRGPQRAALLRVAGVAGPVLASQAVLELARLTAYRLATVVRGGSGARCAYHLFLYARR